MPIAYAYLRVSHEDSAKSGLSPEAQFHRCKKYYEYRIQPEGVDWCDQMLYHDAVSARDVAFGLRPAGGKINRLLRPGDHLVFAYLDRAFRNLQDYCNTIVVWASMDVTIHFVDLGVDFSSANGRLMADIIASISQWFSNDRSERCKEIARQLKRMNRPVNGQKRLGYKLVGPPKDRQWVPDVIELSIMAEIVRLRDEKGMTWQEVSDSVEKRLCEYEGREFSQSIFFRRKWRWDKRRRGYHAYKQFLAEQEQPASSD